MGCHQSTLPSRGGGVLDSAESGQNASNYRPCFRRVSRWIAEEAELKEAPQEPLALYRCKPPWESVGTAPRIIVDLPVATRKSDRPEVRRAAALAAIEALPDADVVIWTDGSAAGGTTRGGAVALIQMPRLGRELKLRAPAGAVCSSLRAEMTAMQTALSAVTSLPEAEIRDIQQVRLLTDSRSGLQQLKRGPGLQPTKLAADVWKLLQELGSRNIACTLQWVPGHAGIEGNEEADQLAGSAAELPQENAAIDLCSARSAISRHVKTMEQRRASAAHPHPKPTPGHGDLPRREAVTLCQLRSGYSPLTRDTLHRIGLAENDRCPACGEADSITHLLCGCDAYAAARQQRWGLDPPLSEILGGPAELIIGFLRRVGRVDPPIDPPTQPST